MREITSALRNIIKVGFSLAMSLLSGVVVGLLLPELFSVKGYGFFKIYTLYVVYTALLHFGFVDGILLRYAGTSYDDLDMKKMRMFSRFFLGFQGIIGAIMIVLGLCLSSSEYGFIVFMLGVNMILVNCTTYYQFISQATERFAEYSVRNVVASVLRIAFVGVLCAIHWLCSMDISYRVYVIGLNVIDAGMLLGYILIYRDITFGYSDSIRKNISEIAQLFKIGILLTIAYQISHLILALDRQFVSVLFPTEEYAVYSFAYNIVSMITTIISSLSIVMLPVLKKLTEELVQAYYKKILSCVNILSAAALLCYFPLTKFVAWFLPEYLYSLKYLHIILLALMYHAAISVVMFTFCKILDQNYKFFLNGCVILVVGLLTNAAAYYFWRTPDAISYASLVTMMLWFVMEGIHLKAVIGHAVYKEFAYITVVGASFWLITEFVASPWIGMIVYAAIIAVVTVTMCKNDVAFMLHRVLKKKA